MAKIYINPGHGGADSGAVGPGGRKEKDDVLKMAKAVAEKLSAAGHEVKLERDRDCLIKVAEIARRANLWGADLFIAFHRNAYDGRAHGSECLIVPGASQTSAKMAEKLASAMAEAGFKNRGVKVQSRNVYVLSHTTMPAVTIECGFIDNDGDNAIFDGKYSRIVENTADAILSVSENAEAPVVTPPEAPNENIPELTRVLKLRFPMMRGEDVRQAQQRLIRHKAYFGETDGLFGRKTAEAVLAFQSARIKEGRDAGCRYNGNMADGKIGELTWAILWE